MASPLDSSLLYNPDLAHEPCRTWLSFTSNANEYETLATTLSGIPKPWLNWAENQVINSEKRGRIVTSRLNYRLTILWNGIILLQETKFICDVLENALRQGFYSHCARQQVKFSDLINCIPGYDNLARNYMKEENANIIVTNPISSKFLSYFTFYQLTETIVRNWKKIHVGKEKKEGFSKLFWKQISCRDVNQFSKDMYSIRKVRNRIAHSKTLFFINETQSIYRVAAKWLTPMSVELKTRIIDYRKERPRFLENVQLT